MLKLILHVFFFYLFSNPYSIQFNMTSAFRAGAFLSPFAGYPKISDATNLCPSGTPASFRNSLSSSGPSASPIQQLPIPNEWAASIMFSAARGTHDH